MKSTIKQALFIICCGVLPLVNAAEKSKTTQAKPELVATHNLAGNSFSLTKVDLRDRTDAHDNPAVVSTQPLSRNAKVEMTGNLFIIKNESTDQGHIFVRQSPMPTSRPFAPKVDITFELVNNELKVELFKDNYEKVENLWTVLPFSGGEFECTAALQNWQRSLRPDTPIHRIPSFVINTWGDRSRDAAINEQFLLKEIDAAKEIGADVLRIDDGWQTGLSGNSAFKGPMKTKGLQGFWGVSSSFWQVNKERLPNGLKPILEKGEKEDVKIGLWYAPDSENEFANWEKDVKTLLELHKTHGINHFKIDGLNIVSPLAHERLNNLLAAVRTQSNDEILLLIDLTGKHKRPGFLGAISEGNLFVENRYTDKGSYWPHRTLRNLWNLSRWVDPGRLRFEFLNNQRNTTQKKYKNQPFAPVNYPADYLFATVMFSNPLGWFEAQNLPAEYRKKMAPLSMIWREHRERIFSGNIAPIGQEPSGSSWTGFVSVSENREELYLLCLREFSQNANYTYRLPVELKDDYDIEILYGDGTASFSQKGFSVSIDNKPGILFLKLKVK